MTDDTADQPGSDDAARVRARNLATAERVFAAVAAGDASAQAANYTEDITLEFPFADPPGRVTGRDTVRDYLGQALGVFELRLTTTAVHPGHDPDTLVVEFTSEGRVRATGTPYTNSYVAVLSFRDGLVCRQREYYNPVPVAQALAG